LLKFRSSNIAILFVLVLAISAFLTSVNAQSTATVTINSAVGGTTDVTGTTTYNAGDTVTITALPDTDFTFVNWIVSSSDGTGDTQPTDNPLTFTATSGATYTITPVFAAPLPIPGQPLPSNLRTAAIVIIYPSAGGVTTPAPGTYALADASNFNLYAIPNSGWQFSHWTICGTNASHGATPVNWTPTDNPYNVNHGYGDTYRYQAIFTPTGSSPQPTNAPTATPATGGTIAGIANEMWIIIGLVVVIVVLLIAFGVYATRRRHP
jgi:hypothetical protein